MSLVRQHWEGGGIIMIHVYREGLSMGLLSRRVTPCNVNNQIVQIDYIEKNNKQNEGRTYPY